MKHISYDKLKIVDNYFETLGVYGYIKDIQTYQAIAALLLLDTVDSFKEYITKEFIETVNKVLRRLECCNCLVEFNTLKCEEPEVPPVEYEFVDLGLPSGTLWAKCNIGAEKETDFGKYFKFGDIVGHDSNVCSHDASIPAVEVDDNNNLLPAYDTATQLMGSDYRMPTKEECEELSKNTHAYLDVINGVIGMRFSKINDSSVYIFIPLAGGCAGGVFANRGREAYLRSSTLYDDETAYYLFCDNWDGQYISHNMPRIVGSSIRAIRK